MKILTPLQVKILEYLLRNGSDIGAKALAQAIDAKLRSIKEVLRELTDEGLLSEAYELSPASLVLLGYNHRFHCDVSLLHCSKEDRANRFPDAHDITSLVGSIHKNLKLQEVAMGCVFHPAYLVFGNKVDAQFMVLAKINDAKEQVTAHLVGLLPGLAVSFRTLIPVG